MHTNKSPRNVWLFSCLGCAGAAFLALAVLVGCGALVASSPAPSDGPSTAEEAADAGSGDGESAEAIGFGDAGDVGDWIVTVDGIETAATYGDEFLEETAQGEFKVVALTVTNDGSESTTFDSSAVSLRDADGAEYSSGYVMGSDSLFLEQINPGNTVEGEAVVDVPAGTEVTSVVIEDVWSFDEALTIDAS